MAIIHLNTDIEERYEIQAQRQAHFPENRIAFYRDFKEDISGDMWDIAKKDHDSFMDYEQGVIPLYILCMRVAHNNYLDRYFEGGAIPTKMMLNELRIMGWDSPTEGAYVIG